MIRKRNLPGTKVVPLDAKGASEQELLSAAPGKMRLPKMKFDERKLGRLRGRKIKGNQGVKGVVTDREEGL